MARHSRLFCIFNDNLEAPKMNKRTLCLGLAALSLAFCSCKSAPVVQADPVPAELTPEEHAVYSSPQFDASPEVIDLSDKTERSISAYNVGSENMHFSDILPLLSQGSGYNQKWEFYIYSKPYSARIKYEISNTPITKNEGKIRGYIKELDENGDTVHEYKINETYKSSAWSASKNALSLNFGDDYTLTLKNGVFVIHGKYEKGTFDYEIEPNLWKPGTGAAYFGKDPDNTFKYSVLAYHKPIQKGVIHTETGDVEVFGHAYGNHYLATLPIYDMFDELADYRKVNSELLVEFRYFVPSQKFDGAPFGYLFVAYEGVPIFGSAHISRTSVEKWLDDGNYNYEIDARQIIEANEDGNSAVFSILKARPEPSDPYADLPAFQRNIATRFAKPIEYSIKMDWQLNLNVDGYTAQIPMTDASYSLTRLR